MTAYRLKHLPSGKYFTPSRYLTKFNNSFPSAASYVKDNLSKYGKVYTRKPSMTFIGDQFYMMGELVVYKPEEWSIEELS